MKVCRFTHFTLIELSVMTGTGRLHPWIGIPSSPISHALVNILPQFSTMWSENTIAELLHRGTGNAACIILSGHDMIGK